MRIGGNLEASDSSGLARKARKVSKWNLHIRHMNLDQEDRAQHLFAVWIAPCIRLLRKSRKLKWTRGPQVDKKSVEKKPWEQATRETL